MQDKPSYFCFSCDIHILNLLRFYRYSHIRLCMRMRDQVQIRRYVPDVYMSSIIKMLLIFEAKFSMQTNLTLNGKMADGQSGR